MTAVSTLLINEMKFGPDQTPIYYAATFVPWTIRPVYAFVTDQVPIFSYRRRPYFVLAAIGACAMQACFALFGHTQYSFEVLAVATQVFLAFSEVVCDALSVEWGNDLAERLMKHQRNEKKKANAAAEPTQPTQPEWSTPLLNEGHSPASSEYNYSSSPAAHPSPVNSSDSQPSQSSKADFLVERVFAHLLATTDPEKLTTLTIKARIQSECMSVRSTGSVFASATSIVMLLYCSPRTVLFSASFVFLLGILTIAYHIQEKKITQGHFFLSGVPDGHAVKPVVVAGVTIVPAPHELFTPADATTPLTAIATTTREQQLDSSATAPLVDTIAEGVQSPIDESQPDANWLCGIPASKWMFLYSKLLALINALIVLWRPLLFIFVVNAMPTSEDAYYNYLYSAYYQFMNWQYGLFNFISLGGSLLGCLFYQKFFAPSTRSIKLIFVATTLASSIIGCSQIFLATQSNDKIGLNDQSFVIIDSFLLGSIQVLAQLPPIILASHFAPKGFGLESSMFSLFAASAHVGSLASAEFSASLTRHLGITQVDFTNLWKLIVICNALAIVPLIMLPFIPAPKATDGSEEVHADAEEQTQPINTQVEGLNQEDKANYAAPSGSYPSL